MLLLHYTMAHNQYFFLLIANNQHDDKCVAADYWCQRVSWRKREGHHNTNGRLTAADDDHQRTLGYSDSKWSPTDVAAGAQLQRLVIVVVAVETCILSPPTLLTHKLNSYYFDVNSSSGNLHRSRTLWKPPSVIIAASTAASTASWSSTANVPLHHHE